MQTEEGCVLLEKMVRNEVSERGESGGRGKGKKQEEEERKGRRRKWRSGM